MLTINKITHLFLSRKRLLVIVSLVLILLFAGYFLLTTFLFGSLADSMENSQAKTLYKQDTKELKAAVQDLSMLLQNTQSYTQTADMRQHFDEYMVALTEMKVPCERIIERYTSPATGTLSDRLADTASNSRGVCHDVLIVVTYAQNVSKAIEPYMTYDEATLTARQELEELVDVSQLSIDRLQAIDRPGLEDPGRQELIVQLENTRDLATGKLNDINRGVGADIGALPTRLQTDKQNFLNARTYFWNNTIMLNRLQAITNRIYAEY